MDLTICQKRELILQTLFPSTVDYVAEETIAEASDSKSKEFPSNLQDKSLASVSDQASDGQIKDEINLSVNDDFLNWLENFESSTDVSWLNNVSPDFMMIKGFLDHFIRLWNLLVHNPVKMENKIEMEEFVSLLDEMKQLRASMNMSDSVIEKDTVIVLSKKIRSGRSKVEHILYQLNLVQRNTNVESDPSQASTAVGNDDHKQNVLKESKGNVSNNSQGPVNSGHEKAKENNKGGNNNKSKKNKRGKKGKK